MMIKAENINKSFGKLHVLKNINLEVQKARSFPSLAFRLRKEHALRC